MSGLRSFAQPLIELKAQLAELRAEAEQARRVARSRRNELTSVWASCRELRAESRRLITRAGKVKGSQG
jgi:hypothetical protein